MFKDRSVSTRLFKSDNEIDCICVGVILCLFPLVAIFWAIGWATLKVTERV